MSIKDTEVGVGTQLWYTGYGEHSSGFVITETEKEVILQKVVREGAEKEFVLRGKSYCFLTKLGLITSLINDKAKTLTTVADQLTKLQKELNEEIKASENLD